jgi:hypothetical protein
MMMQMREESKAKIGVYVCADKLTCSKDLVPNNKWQFWRYSLGEENKSGVDLLKKFN